MTLTASAALWFAPFVLPLCFYVAWTDMSRMRITNQSVIVLLVIYVTIGLIEFPLDTYLWGYRNFAVILLVGIVLNACGAVGAGDVKFAAAAAPNIQIGDLRFLMALFAANLLAAFVGHRLAKISPLRGLAPDWKSWKTGSRLPMGLALGGTLSLYLGLGIFFGK